MELSSTLNESTENVADTKQLETTLSINLTDQQLPPSVNKVQNVHIDGISDEASIKAKALDIPTSLQGHFLNQHDQIPCSYCL